MNAKYHTNSSLETCLPDFLFNPTNFSYSDYEARFGSRLADIIFSSLYKNNRGSLPYRQLYPVNTLSDSFAVKYQFKLYDNRQIETVCIKRRTGNTICLSTQAGCSVGCVFCESGKNGLYRNLTASEIIQQFLFVKEPVNRIVFMGIGEPLNNYDEVLRAIHILRDRKGIDFPTDGITVSTVGPLGALNRLKQEKLKIQLIVSLHATDQLTRNKLIPGMQRYSINETISEAFNYQRRHNRKLVIAYLLLPEINDSTENAERLIQWFGNKNVVINLMRYNGKTTPYLRTASNSQIHRFMKHLRDGSVDVSLRETAGGSINAACGQLITEEV